MNCALDDFKSAVSADFTIRAMNRYSPSYRVCTAEAAGYFPEYTSRYISRLRMMLCTYSRVSVYGIDSTHSGMSL
jgi:hypothetical protein